MAGNHNGTSKTRKGTRFDGLEGFKDVTDLFLTATNELAVGQLLQADNFTLSDGMTSIEIMDPKMDSGMILPAPNREILGQEAIRNLSLAPAEILGIMDTMLAQEVRIPNE